ncbi:MAG: polysaccharide deacetylase family protein [Anaerolineales bacterium]|nr:polysaccharide deacetylase family protein [Anaerolineales bacterium]
MPVPNYPFKILAKFKRRLAPHLPLAVYRRAMPRNPVGFFYHAVSDTPLPHLQHLYPSKTAAEFEQDLLWLKQNYTLLDYSVLQALAQSPNHPITQLPNSSAFLSFDDGFTECYTVARPLLLKHRIPSLFFLATDWIDNQSMYYRGKMSLILDKLTALDPDAQTETLHRLTTLHPPLPTSHLSLATFSSWLLAHQQSAEPLIDQLCDTLELDIPSYLRTHQPFLTRAQIREMQAEGFVFGAHTRRHPKLNTLPQEEQTAEIIESCRIVCEITGQAQVPFAFPFSGSGVDRDFLANLRAQHPHIGLIFDTQKLRRDRPFIFHRIWADKPLLNVPPPNNLAHWLHDAYIRELSR